MRYMSEILNSILGYKILRYLLVGGVGATVDLAIFSVATYYFSLPWLLSSVISSLVSTLVGYYLSICFVFQSEVRYKKYQEIAGVILISFLAFLMHQALLYCFIEILDVNMIISKMVVIGSIFFFNYFSRSKIIFSGKSSGR